MALGREVAVVMAQGLAKGLAFQLASFVLMPLCQ
jgi:hypothetical protein